MQYSPPWTRFHIRALWDGRPEKSLKKYGARNDVLLNKKIQIGRIFAMVDGIKKVSTYLFDRIRLNKELGIGRSAELLNDISHCFCILTDCMILKTCKILYHI